MFVSFFPQPEAVFHFGGCLEPRRDPVLVLRRRAAWSRYSASAGAAGCAARCSAFRFSGRSHSSGSTSILAFFVGAFYAFWRVYSPHRWQNWSILGSALILFSTYLSVQINVALNNWRGPFFDLFQKALTTPGSVSAGELYSMFSIYAWIGGVGMGLFVITRFFVSHYIFRWRTAMNDYYMAHWQKLRHIEGASQRVQEDTMRFSTTMEGLGVSLVDSAMTLIAFLPLLAQLSTHVKVLPLVGEIPYSLVVAAVSWSIFGTLLLMVAGVKIAGAGVQEPARRGGLPQGIGLWRGRCRPGPAADGRRTVFARPPQLLHALFSLCLFQHRALGLPAGRRHFLKPDPHPDDRRRHHHARHLATSLHRLRPGQLIVPVSGQCMADDRRTACRSTSACALSKRLWTTSRCPTSIGTIWKDSRPTPWPDAAGQPPMAVLCGLSSVLCTRAR